MNDFEVVEKFKRLLKDGLIQKNRALAEIHISYPTLERRLDNNDWRPGEILLIRQFLEKFN